MSHPDEQSSRDFGDSFGEVRFNPSFARRLERWLARFGAARRRPAARAGFEGLGRGPVGSAGFEFLGYRPYRAGEDLRDLDWDVLARTDQPFLRVHRREAGERWMVLLDTSASMGVRDLEGARSKLQLASEACAAIAMGGAQWGARVELRAGRGGATVGKRVDLANCLAFLEAQRAEGEHGLRELLAQAAASGAQRIFAVGDLLDLEPGELAALGRTGRELRALQVLAPHELVPPAELAAVDWLDPEARAHLPLAIDAAVRGRYERALASRLEAWRQLCARHRIAYHCFDSSRDFEELAAAALQD
jgi:uncharacterized protein (DUF58 family)